MSEVHSFGLLTYFIMTSALQVGVFILMLHIYLTQKTYPGFSQWMLAPLIQALAFIMYGMHGLTGPRINILFPNLLFVIAVPVRLEGFLHFLAPSGYARLILYSRVACVAGCLGVVAAFLTGHSAPTSIFVSSAVVGVFQIAIIALLVFYAVRTKEAVLWFLASCHGVVLVLCLTRAIGVLAHQPTHYVSSPTPQVAIMVTLASVASLLATVGVMFLNSARVNKEFWEMHRELQTRAAIDVLTGLLNRRTFVENGESLVALAIRHERPLSLLMCDIDHFKTVNDTFGHEVGDVTLMTVATTIREALRGSDIAGRLGGEEFGIILPETDMAGAKIVAEEIRIAVALAKLPVSSVGTVTVSIGVASLTAATVNLQSLLRIADEGLYRAKHSGRNRWVAAADSVTLPGMPHISV